MRIAGGGDGVSVTVATCGSVNIDVTAFSERLPRPGETIHGERYSMSLGGKGANQAAAVARLGARSLLIGRTGADAFGDLARTRLAEIGVDLACLAKDQAAATGIAVITVDRRAENSIVVIGGTNMRVDRSDVENADAALAAARVLLLQLEIPLTTALAAASAMRARGGRVVFDPAPAPAGGLPAEAFALMDVVTPNETETEMLVGIRPVTRVEAADAAGKLVARGARAAVIKMGARGVFYRDAESEGFVPPFAVTAVNSVGAGDCFNGGLAVALARGEPLAAAVRFAAACGALAVTGPGGADSAPTLAAVEKLLSLNPV
jgi:ribokinase